MINFLDVKNRDELRQWLMDNHDTAKECWVVVKRGRPVDDDTFWYIDAVKDICFRGKTYSQDGCERTE